MYDPNNDEPIEYEVEVVKTYYFKLRVKAFSESEAQSLAKDEVENMLTIDAYDEEIDVIDITHYEEEQEPDEEF